MSQNPRQQSLLGRSSIQSDQRLGDELILPPLPAEHSKIKILVKKNWILIKRQRKQVTSELLRTVMLYGILIILGMNPPVVDVTPENIGSIYTATNPSLASISNVCGDKCFIGFSDVSTGTGCSPKLQELMNHINVCDQETNTTQLGCKCVLPKVFNDIDKIAKEKLSAGVEFKGTWDTTKRAEYILHSAETLLDRAAYSKNTIVPLKSTERLLTGFAFSTGSYSALQAAVDSALISMASKKESSISLLFQAFPTPAYKTVYSSVKGIAPYYLLSIISITIYNLIGRFVEEREKKLAHILHVSGVRSSEYLLSWGLFVVARLLITVVLSTSVTIYLCPQSNALLPLLHNIVSALAMIVQMFLVASICSTSKAAMAICLSVPSLLGALTFIVSTEWHTGPILPDSVVYLFCFIFPPFSMCYGNLLLIAAEIPNDPSGGIGLGNMNDSAHGLPVSFGINLLCLVVSSLFYFLLAIYLDNVVPKTGVLHEQDKLFCLRCKKKTSQDELGSEDYNYELDVREDACESPPRDCKPAVRILNLAKIFDGGVRAVNGLNMTFYEDQITSFLGHNGAGKSTTINLLTGLFPITSGDALVYGRSVKNDLASVRRIIGVCPQENLLWENMTVEEHLDLFCGLRGVQDLEGAKTDILQELNLADKRSAFAKNLSGGQKRKLCVAMSVIGDPKVMFFDEPTAGMDAQTRRTVWGMLLKKRKGHCIVLCSHHMDEAEILGDRIAVVSAGKLQASGSSLFLKQHFKLGSRLNISLAAGCPRKEVMALVERNIPSAELSVDELFDMNALDEDANLARQAAQAREIILDSTESGDLIVALPFDAQPSFPALLRDLDQKKQDDVASGNNGVQTYGLEAATLEDVFLKLKHDQDHNTDADAGEEEEEEEKAEGAHRSMSQVPQTDDRGFNRLDVTPPPCCSKLGYQLRMKVLNTRRDAKMVCQQMVVPYFLMLAAVLLGQFIGYLFEPGSLRPAEMLDVSNVLSFGPSFDLPYACTGGVKKCSASETEIMDIVEAWSKQGVSGVPSTEDVSYVCEPGFQDKCSPAFAESILKDADKRNDASALRFFSNADPDPRPTPGSTFAYNLLFNTQIAKSIPAVVSLLHSALLNSITGQQTKEPVIRTGYQQLPTNDDEVSSAMVKEVVRTVGGYATGFLATFGFMTISSSVIQRIIKEKESKAKHMQLLMGVKGWEYWATQLVFDFTIFSITCTVGMITFVATETPLANWATVVLFAAFGFSLFSFYYCLSFLFDSAVTAQAVSTTVVFVSFTVFFSLEAIMSTNVWSVIKVIGYCLPYVAFNSGILSITLSGSLLIPGPSSDVNLLSYDVAGEEVMYLLISGILFFMIVLVTEHRRMKNDCECLGECARSCERCCTRRPHHATPQQRSVIEAEATHRRRVQDMDLEDEDVKAERQQTVYNPDEHVVRYEGLRKVFPRRGRELVDCVAVKNMDLCMRHGECFALLGTNGAGKSTSLGVLLREHFATEGRALLNNFDVSDPPVALFQSVGYCPQANALFEKMTGREVLSYYSSIRGVPQHLLSEYVEWWLVRAGLSEYSDRQCGKYSGGNKRKLSLAISLVGNPVVSVLDEPSAGMDPAARRNMWRVINQWRSKDSSNAEQSRRTVVLTTHYMDEADKLGDRIGIMVAGQLACIGSSQHLKSRYGSGYKMEIKCFVGHSVQPLVEVIQKLCPASEIEEMPTDNFVQLALGRADQFFLPGLFEAVEQQKDELHVEAYSIGQTSMEQVFLKVAEVAEYDEFQSVPEQDARYFVS